MSLPLKIGTTKSLGNICIVVFYGNVCDNYFVNYGITERIIMHLVKKISPCYQSSISNVEIIGKGETEALAIESFRAHLLENNTRILTLNETMVVPDMILDLAHANIDRNKDLDIVVREDGVVFVDGNGPEMDYYMIVEGDTAG